MTLDDTLKAIMLAARRLKQKEEGIQKVSKFYGNLFIFYRFWDF